MQQMEMDTSAVMGQIVQAVCDLAPRPPDQERPLAGRRVLDLGCAHGHYSFEMARRGAQVLGIEGRESWLAQARRAQQEGGWQNVSFVQDDARNLSRETYGEFDVVLCLGLLYHLNAPDVFDFVQRVFDVCGDFAVFETHVAARPARAHAWRGRQYWGVHVQEHAAGASAAQKLQRMGASLDNERSFWLTRPSLHNLLRHVGFTSVYACHVPLANLYVGPERAMKIWGSRTTLIAVKGRPVTLDGGREAEDWPENWDDYRLEQYLDEQRSPLVGRLKGRLRRLLRSVLRE